MTVNNLRCRVHGFIAAVTYEVPKLNYISVYLIKFVFDYLATSNKPTLLPTYKQPKRSLQKTNTVVLKTKLVVTTLVFSNV